MEFDFEQLFLHHPLFATFYIFYIFLHYSMYYLLECQWNIYYQFTFWSMAQVRPNGSKLLAFRCDKFTICLAKKKKPSWFMMPFILWNIFNRLSPSHIAMMISYWMRISTNYYTSAFGMLTDKILKQKASFFLARCSDDLKITYFSYWIR